MILSISILEPESVISPVMPDWVKSSSPPSTGILFSPRPPMFFRVPSLSKEKVSSFTPSRLSIPPTVSSLPNTPRSDRVIEVKVRSLVTVVREEKSSEVRLLLQMMLQAFFSVGNL